jgi:DMSO reductase family type II enzyme chaperone
MSAMPNSTGSVANSYLAMAQMFSYPTRATWERMSQLGLLDAGVTLDQLEAEYLAAFEIGRDAKPVPLFEGMNRTDMARDGVLEDLLRFYEFFDIELAQGDREYPDHLATELEFLAWLCQRESAARNEGGDAEPFRLAARDFIDRHLAVWLPEFQRRLERSGTAYEEYGAALAELLTQHRSNLDSLPH